MEIVFIVILTLVASTVGTITGFGTSTIMLTILGESATPVSFTISFRGAEIVNPVGAKQLVHKVNYFHGLCVSSIHGYPVILPGS